MSVIVHEISHGYAAKLLGDDTADLAGRLTLNPLKHLDPMGSVLIPFLLIVSKAGFVFGWAKPVPYNPQNLRDQKWGTVIVASAGIASNLSIALIFSIIIRLTIAIGFNSPAFISICGIVVLLNIVLAIFNLVPIPPLDGSRILFALLPPRLRNIQMYIEQYGFILLIIFIVFLWQYLAPIIYILYKLLTGLAL